VVKLTVLYNLKDAVAVEDFLRWRTTEHQEDTMALPGIIKSDLYMAVDDPDGNPPAYRFVSESYFPDRATLENLFYREETQEELRRTTSNITDVVFLISEEIVSSDTSGRGE